MPNVHTIISEQLSCCNFFARSRVTVFWRMARYVDAKFADKEVLSLNADES